LPAVVAAQIELTRIATRDALRQRGPTQPGNTERRHDPPPIAGACRSDMCSCEDEVVMESTPVWLDAGDADHG